VEQMIPMNPAPFYTPETCPRPAYPLDWSYSIFWRTTPRDFSWLEDLRALSEKDHIRILQHEFRPPNVSQFLVSTRPEVVPLIIAQRVKGRLQHLIHSTSPDAFRRNYALRSVGSTRREKLERYLADQLEHHPMADPRVSEEMRAYQLHFPEVDLSQPRCTSHAQYWCNLHIVLVHERRYREIRPHTLSAMRSMVVNASAAKGHLLSRASILPDHLHLTLGCKLDATSTRFC
jgi:hypothetical protein